MAADAAVGAPPHAARHRSGPTVAGLVGRGVAWLVLAWLVIFLGRWGSSDHYATATIAVIYAVIALSLNVLIGYTGQISLGHQGFLGLGALTAAYLVSKQQWPFALSVAGAVAAAAAAALLLGLVALRIRGLYLALITLVFGLTLQVSLFEVEALTGGGAGQPANRPASLLENQRFYWFCLSMLLVVFYVDRQLTRSKTGRALLALKENERVAAAFGINVTAYKLVAFTVAGAFVGLAGAMFAYKSQAFSPADYGFRLALIFVVMTVVGGIGSRIGAVLGGVLFGVLDEWILHPIFTWEPFSNQLAKVPVLKQLTGDNVVYVPLFFGALLLLLTLTKHPGGMAQQFRPIIDWLSGKPFSLHHDKEAGPSAVEGSSVRA